MKARMDARLLGMVGVTTLIIAGIAAAQSAATGAGAGPRTIDTLLRIGGRMHPMLVHFPIAMVLVAAGIETGRAILRRPTPARTSINMLGIGVLTAAAAIASGWLNGDFENHASNAETLELHRWVGIGGGAGALLAFVVGLGASKSRRALVVFRVLLLAAAGAIGFTGHLGGSMVYGEGYLLAPLKMGAEPLRSEPIRDEDPRAPREGSAVGAGIAGPVSFDRDVLPIFEARCVECHGPSRARASLRLDSLERAMDAEPWVLSIAEPERSDLIARVKMSQSEDGAMPPKGERLAAREIALIEAWIVSLARERNNEGARVDDVLPTLGSSERGGGSEPFVDSPLSLDDPGAQAWSAEQITVLRSLRSRGARIEPVSAESDLLDANLSLMSPACDGDALAMLSPILPRIQRLDLSGSALTSGDLAAIAGAESLRSLTLNRTGIDDSVAGLLASLPMLETLVVTGTQFGDSGLRALSVSATLRRVYAADSRVTAAGVSSVSEAFEVTLGVPDRGIMVYLVRHAEKESEGADPGLTEAGLARAGALAVALLGEPIDAVYVTQFTRTQLTAKPLADRAGVRQTVIEAGRDIAAHASEVAAAVRRGTRGRAVLIAGHSNTIPEIVRALGVNDAIVIDDSQYGDLFVVELRPDGARLVDRRRFGA
ncbi:MAG: histidine phosphatase family protein [Phycisphaeraceae bacterium]|nr:MAG: histidine phosphatase family protein [Phycisphaeraceae bacterium]